MCGRFSLSLSASDVKKLFDIDLCYDAVQSYIKTWNISPGMSSPVFFSEESQRTTLSMMKWGMPQRVFSSKKQGVSINTRCENFIEKTYYRQFLESRCVIPATGYYEWMKQSGLPIPFYIKHAADKCLFLAGIHDEGSAYSIITTEARSDLKHIHGRMPFILSRDYASLWIKEKNLKPSDMTEMLLAKNMELEYYSVSMFVNSTANNSVRCIERVSYNEQPDLF